MLAGDGVGRRAASAAREGTESQRHLTQAGGGATWVAGVTLHPIVKKGSLDHRWGGGTCQGRRTAFLDQHLPRAALIIRNALALSSPFCGGITARGAAASAR